MAMTTETQTKRLPIVRLLLAFAALCLVTSFVLGLTGGSSKVLDDLPADGGVIGPLQIDEADTIFDIQVYQPIPLGHWSSVTVSLLDTNKQYLLGLGDGFWHEEGRDYEGYYWRESKTSYQGKLTIGTPGEYFLEISTENNFDASDLANAPIEVDVDEGGFSPIPHRAIGIVALIFAIVVGLIKYREIFLEMIQEQ